MATDRWLNVLLFNGEDTMTVSMHAAEAEVAGATWGCWTCFVLNWLVQRHHCALTLDPNTKEAAGAAIRAGLVMIAGFTIFGVALHYALRIF